MDGREERRNVVENIMTVDDEPRGDEEYDDDDGGEAEAEGQRRSQLVTGRERGRRIAILRINP